MGTKPFYYFYESSYNPNSDLINHNYYLNEKQKTTKQKGYSKKKKKTKIP